MQGGSIGALSVSLGASTGRSCQWFGATHTHTHAYMLMCWLVVRFKCNDELHAETHVDARTHGDNGLVAHRYGRAMSTVCSCLQVRISLAHEHSLVKALVCASRAKAAPIRHKL